MSLPWRETVCVFMDVPGYQVTMCVQVYAQLGGACAPGAHTCAHSCEGRSIWFPQIASPAPDGAPIPSWQVPGLNIWPRLPMGRESWHPARARRAQPSPSAYTPTEGQGLCPVTGQSRDSPASEDSGPRQMLSWSPPSLPVLFPVSFGYKAAWRPHGAGPALALLRTSPRRRLSWPLSRHSFPVSGRGTSGSGRPGPCGVWQRPATEGDQCVPVC